MRPIPLPVTASAVLLFRTAVLAAECDGYGICNPLGGSSSREDLYAARQHVCGDTDKWKTAGQKCAHGGGWISWPSGDVFTQQMCWDAFENIINQCRPFGMGLGYHMGIWKWAGKQYAIHGCSQPSCVGPI